MGDHLDYDVSSNGGEPPEVVGWTDDDMATLLLRYAKTLASDVHIQTEKCGTPSAHSKTTVHGPPQRWSSMWDSNAIARHRKWWSNIWFGLKDMTTVENVKAATSKASSNASGLPFSLFDAAVIFNRELGWVLEDSIRAIIPQIDDWLVAMANRDDVMCHDEGNDEATSHPLCCCSCMSSVGCNHVSCDGIQPTTLVLPRFLDLSRTNLIADPKYSPNPLPRWLTRLDLSRTVCENSCIPYIKECSMLTHLSLEETKITDDGLELLAASSVDSTRMKYLNTLNVAAPLVSANGARIIAAMPSCQNLYVCPQLRKQFIFPWYNPSMTIPPEEEIVKENTATLREMCRRCGFDVPAQRVKKDDYVEKLTSLAKKMEQDNVVKQKLCTERPDLFEGPACGCSCTCQGCFKSGGEVFGRRNTASPSAPASEPTKKGTPTEANLLRKRPSEASTPTPNKNVSWGGGNTSERMSVSSLLSSPRSIRPGPVGNGDGSDQNPPKRQRRRSLIHSLNNVAPPQVLGDGDPPVVDEDTPPQNRRSSSSPSTLSSLRSDGGGQHGPKATNATASDATTTDVTNNTTTNDVTNNTTTTAATNNLTTTDVTNNSTTTDVTNNTATTDVTNNTTTTDVTNTTVSTPGRSLHTPTSSANTNVVQEAQLGTQLINTPPQGDESTPSPSESRRTPANFSSRRTMGRPGRVGRMSLGGDWDRHTVVSSKTLTEEEVTENANNSGELKRLVDEKKLLRATLAARTPKLGAALWRTVGGRQQRDRMEALLKSPLEASPQSGDHGNISSGNDRIRKKAMTPSSVASSGTSSTLKVGDMSLIADLIDITTSRPNGSVLEFLRTVHTRSMKASPGVNFVHLLTNRCRILSQALSFINDIVEETDDEAKLLYDSMAENLQVTQSQLDALT